MIETKSKVITGNPVGFIYCDNPAEKSGVIHVFVPNTKMNMNRKVTGNDLHLRAAMAGQAVAGIVSNFIENNPILGNQQCKVAVVDGKYGFMSDVYELAEPGLPASVPKRKGPKPGFKKKTSVKRAVEEAPPSITSETEFPEE